MNSETKNCQNCKKDFTIEVEDFDFYEKMNVPPPTWCPECRLIRRMAIDNVHVIYSGRCALCAKPQISGLHPSSPLKGYCNECWWGDSWDGLDYGRDVDFTKPFLSQVKELMADVPWMARPADSPTMENSEYCMNVGNLKNCYLLFHGDFDENCAYCDTTNHSKDCFDCTMLVECELCYASTHLQTCYKAFYCVDCDNSNDILFCRDLSGCSNCFGCVGLRKKEYCFFNEQLTKEQYEQRLADFQEGSYQAQATMIARAHRAWLQFPKKYMHGTHNEDVSGDYIAHSKNTHSSFQALQCEDSKYIAIVGLVPVKDSYDYTSWGDGASRIYECTAVGMGVDAMKFTYMSWPSCSEIEYSMYAVSSSNCFGCVGVRNKKYCILNKQYTKDEYEALVVKIKQHMLDMPYTDSIGRVYRYGEFFPSEFSPFAYNESRVQEFFPLTKKEAIAKGYAWRDEEDRIVSATVQSAAIPDHIRDVPDSFTKEIIACEHAAQCTDRCTRAFKVIKQEFDFYRRMNLPLPRLCPNCRYGSRTVFRNPMKLWDRQCMCAGASSQNGVYRNSVPHSHGTSQCPAEFKTSYSPPVAGQAPEWPDIIYCAECYQSEMV